MSDVTARVSLVTKDLMKYRVDYRLTVLFTPYIRGGRGWSISDDL